MAEHKEMIGFRIPKYLKNWVDLKVKSGEFATQSEFLIYVLSEYRSREDIRELVQEVVREEIPGEIQKQVNEKIEQVRMDLLLEIAELRTYLKNVERK